tara:strand:+ start:18250 stop:19755 length:1506 start_codon:yes stop_codon:yes gene_type:complete
MMKKITLKIVLFLTFGLVSFAVSAQTFYYEDFRYENTGRGFTVQHVNLGGQSASQVGRRVSDIVDATDSNPVFDESSRLADRIPSSVTREQRTIAFTNTSGAAPNLVNYEIEAWALMTNQDLSTTNGAKVTFWTQQRFVVGAGSKLEILVSENYTHGAGNGAYTDSPPSAATWINETANISGNIATADVSSQTYVSGELDLSAYTGTSVTVAFRVVTTNTAYEADVTQHGTFYISDVHFDASREDIANGAFTALNTSSSGQTGVFNTPSASIADSNFSNTSKWADIFTSQTAVPRLANGVTIPVNEGYKFEIADKYNPAAISEVSYTLANATSNKGAFNGEAKQSIWKVQGSNNDSTWDDLSEERGMFSTNSGTSAYSFPLTTTKAYRYYRFVLAEAWTPNQNFTALLELNFTVDNTVLSTENNILYNSFSVYPNPSNNIINISNTNINVKNVKLIDVTGKAVYYRSNSKTINVSNFAKGLYILKIESKEGNVFSKKVIIN